MDAWSVTDQDMELEGRTCEEYIGIDVKKYAEMDREKRKNELLMRKVSDPKKFQGQAFDMAVRADFRTNNRELRIWKKSDRNKKKE